MNWIDQFEINLSNKNKKENKKYLEQSKRYYELNMEINLTTSRVIGSNDEAGSVEEQLFLWMILWS